MKHQIDPKIDCVFKALLGAEENRNLLIHFLNALLKAELPQPITQVEILNPYNAKEFVSDKLSIVDIKARDDKQQLYQIEIQLLNYPSLPARILYNWADIYTQQLQSGQDYGLLKPTYTIWLLAENVLKNDSVYLHNYKLRDESGAQLHEHGGIWLVELNKFNIPEVETEDQRWLKFFKDGESLDDAALPNWMNTLEMRQAMTTLRLFSEKERQYFQYQARQEYLREQRAIQQALDDGMLAMQNLSQLKQTLETTSRDLETTSAALLQERLEKQSAVKKAEQVEAELAQLKQLLASKHLN